MKKQKFAFVLALCLCMTLLMSLAACGNRQLIDTTYTFKSVQIHMPDGTTVSGVCESWLDYENSDAVQIVVDGEAYYTHLSRVVLTTKEAKTD